MTDGLLQSTFAFLYWAGLMTWRKMAMLNMAGTFVLIAFLFFRLEESP